MSRLRALASWEALLALLLVALVAVGANLHPTTFLTAGNFSNLTSAVMETAIMALPLTLIIVTGEIDLSVESMLGLSCAVLGALWAAGVPLEAGIPIVLLIGMAGGLFNGLLVARGGLPSLVVTLGTLALFRGLALVVLGSQGISKFPEWFTDFGFGTIGSTPIPWSLLVFTILAIVLGLALHRTWIGRQIFAIGKNKDAARYSGVRVQRAKLLLFVLSGTIAAVAGVIITARFASARADIGTGLTLTAVTMVLLGGVNINGGRGTIPGVVIAVFVLAVLGNVLRLANVSAEWQSIAVGALLIISVVIPNVAHQADVVFGRTRRVRRPPAGSPEPGEAAEA